MIKKRVFNKIKYHLLRNNINILPKYYNDTDSIDLSPIFILGGNRSGTSLISSLVAQHYSIEGIFGNNDSPKYSKYGKHVLAFSTSHHVWDFLLNTKKDWFSHDEGVLWGHPKNISQYYLDKPKNKKQSLILANAIQDYRRTEKIPLLNSHFNMFRIGMIKKIFPNSKFILIIKDYKEIITSCYDKWQKQNIEIDYPKIGLHWFTLNCSCLYDLQKYALDDYCVIDYSELFYESTQTNEMLNTKLQKIGLDKFSYDLKIINPDYRFINTKDSKQLNFNKYFGWIESLVSDESKIINT